MQDRKRKPVKPHTVSSWKSHLKWINSRMGDMPLSNVNNLALKGLVSEMSEAGFSPKTIWNYLQVAKMVVASAIGDDAKLRVCLAQGGLDGGRRLSTREHEAEIAVTLGKRYELLARRDGAHQSVDARHLPLHRDRGTRHVQHCGCVLGIPRSPRSKKNTAGSGKSRALS